MARRASLCDLTGKWKPKYICVYDRIIYLWLFVYIYIYISIYIILQNCVRELFIFIYCNSIIYTHKTDNVWMLSFLSYAVFVDKLHVFLWKTVLDLRLRAWFDPPSAPFRPWPQHSGPNSGTDLPSWRCSLSQGVPRTGWSSPWIFRVGLPAEFWPKNDGDFSKNQAEKRKKWNTLRPYGSQRWLRRWLGRVPGCHGWEWFWIKSQSWLILMVCGMVQVIWYFHIL